MPAPPGWTTRLRGMWSSDYWKLVMMTPDEVNGHTDAADVDVRSIMKLDAVDTEVGTWS